MSETEHVPLRFEKLASVLKAAPTEACAVTTTNSEPNHCNQQIPIHFKNSWIRSYTAEQ